MNVVRVRPGVKFDRIAPAGFVILATLHSATRVLGLDIVITCGTDGNPPDDPHTMGEAYDVSVAAYEPLTTYALWSFLSKALGPLFTVLYETPYAPDDTKLAAIAYINAHASGPHLHLQRKTGAVFPPIPGAPQKTMPARK